MNTFEYQNFADFKSEELLLDPNLFDNYAEQMAGERKARQIGVEAYLAARSRTTRENKALTQAILDSTVSPTKKLQRIRELGLAEESKRKKEVSKKEPTESDRAQIKKIMNSNMSPAAKLQKVRDLGLA